MADQEEYSDREIEIRSLDSEIRKLYEKLEDNVLEMMKDVEESSSTNDQTERDRELTEMLNESREEARKIFEENADFVHPENKNNSPDMENARKDLLKECAQKLKNLDMGNQERNGEKFGDQEKGEEGNSSEYVPDDEKVPKDPIFSLDDSDTSSEEAIQEWKQKKEVDPDLKRRFLGKALAGSSSESDFCAAETSGERVGEDVKKDSGTDPDMEDSTNIEGLMEELKKFY